MVLVGVRNFSIIGKVYFVYRGSVCYFKDILNKRE